MWVWGGGAVKLLARMGPNIVSSFGLIGPLPNRSTYGYFPSPQEEEQIDKG